MTLDTRTLEPGDRVSYEDMANPRREYTVVERVTDRWGTFFRLAPVGENPDREDLKSSDCRQAGWNLEADPVTRITHDCGGVMTVGHMDWTALVCTFCGREVQDRDWTVVP